MIHQPFFSRWNFGWFIVVDEEANFSVVKNNDDITKIDAWQLQFEIRVEDFEIFEMCLRPDDFDVTLNKVLADVGYIEAEPLPQELINWTTNDGVTLKRVQIVYPPVEEIDADTRPYLIIQLIADLSSLPLASVNIEVLINDAVNDLAILDLIITIDSDYSKVTIFNNLSPQLVPLSNDGDFFNIIQG